MKSASNDLTVLVFKENSVARTFRVPIQWISKLGLIAGIIAAIAVSGVFLSAKYYLASRQASRAADPAYTQELENQVASLRSDLKAADARTAEAKAFAESKTAALPIVAALPNIIPSAPAVIEHPAPVETVAATAGARSALIFSALPAAVEAPPPAADIPIIIYDPHVNWVGRTLKAQFFIQYTKEDKGNQQGRIVVLARGGDTVLAYPSGILNSGDSASLIAPDKGEYFSVSHIREVKADFGPMKSNTALKEIEVFLFGNNDRLLVHQILTPGTNGPAGPNTSSSTMEKPAE